jgi:hypothetical protein
MDRLCSACEMLIAGTGDFAEWSAAQPAEVLELEQHERGGCSLRDAAHAGCPLCQHIWRSLSPEQRYRACQYHLNPLKFPGFDAKTFATRYRLESAFPEFGFLLRYLCHYAKRIDAPKQQEFPGYFPIEGKGLKHTSVVF